jgi:capsule export inner-membrane protein ctrB
MMESSVKKPKINRIVKYFDPLFWLFVVLPTIVLAIYYGFIASDVYTSESKFVIRSPNQRSVSGIGMVLQNIGFNASSDDSYLVRDYLSSRDAVQNLKAKLDIQTKYSAKSVDVVSRFGTIKEPTFENFYEYFNKKIKVVYDPASSISSLQIEAYTAKDAQNINEELLKMSEEVINRINNNAKNDILVASEKEVQEAQEVSAKAAEALAKYRVKNDVFNPEGQSAIVLQEISKLQDALIQAETQLTQAREITPENPQIKAMETRIKSLKKSIADKSKLVTGPSDISFSNRSVEYQRLQLEKELADKQLASAMATYEQSKNDFNKKQLYLERLAMPSLPDEATKPKRFKDTLSGFVFGLLLWGVVRLFVAGVREHND